MELTCGSPEIHGCPRFQLHIFPGLKGLQPVEDSAVFAPGSSGPAWDWLDLGDGLALHLEIDLGVAIRRGRTRVPQQMTDCRKINARFQKGHGRTVSNAVRMQPLFAEVRSTGASQSETPGENMADSKTG